MFSSLLPDWAEFDFLKRGRAAQREKVALFFRLSKKNSQSVKLISMMGQKIYKLLQRCIDVTKNAADERPCQIPSFVIGQCGRSSIRMTIDRTHDFPFAEPVQSPGRGALSPYRGNQQSAISSMEDLYLLYTDELSHLRFFTSTGHFFENQGGNLL
jgi:hypothetical protein